MSRENEKVLAELRKFLELHNEELNDEKDFDRLAEQFLSQHNGSPDGGSMGEIETADDYLELAEQAASKKKRLNYLKKALELEPDHVDAQLQLILTEAEDAPEARLTALEDLIKKAAKPLEEEGCFERGTGAFWGIMETRPYMRVRREYLGSLIECGMMQLAIEECRQLLELCEGDNLGIRYLLMHLYAYTEDELHALALHRKYAAYEETQMLLPLSILYYKLHQLDKAEDHLKRLASVNKDTKKFLRIMINGDPDALIDHLDPYGYRPFTIEELTEELVGNAFLFSSVPHFFAWASNCLSKRTGGKAKRPEKGR